MHTTKVSSIVYVLIIGIQIIFASIGYAQTQNEFKDYLQASPKDMQWWTNAKFGMFICWGPVSETGKEIGWSRAGERRGLKGTGTTPVEVYDNLYIRCPPMATGSQGQRGQIHHLPGQAS